MKKAYLFILILYLGIVKSYAQSDLQKSNVQVINLHQEIKYGIMGGCSFNKLKTINRSFQYMNIERESVPAAGLFVEFPMSESVLALRVEAVFMKSAYSYHSNERYSISSGGFQPITINKTAPETDLLMDIKTISIPLLIRISENSQEWGFFVDLGIVLSFNVQNDAHCYIVESRSGGIYIDEVMKRDLSADALIGYSLGLGYYRYFGKSRVYIEARTMESTPLDKGEFNINQHQLVAGFSL